MPIEVTPCIITAFTGSYESSGTYSLGEPAKTFGTLFPVQQPNCGYTFFAHSTDGGSGILNYVALSFEVYTID